MLETNIKTISEIMSRYYFTPIKEGLEAKTKKIGEINALDYLTEIMQKATSKVEVLIQERIKTGIISSADQARKTIAGNGFQGLAAYSLIKLQEKNMLNPNLAITLKPKKHPLIEKYATIKVGDDVQKPDIDLLIYHYQKPEKYPVIIYSIKTSLRERAGQTYRWKLLMDIVSSNDCKSIKEKYSLVYKAMDNFKVGFITTNFYNEIINPQQKGMLKFFDFVYITKPGKWEKPVCEFSKILDDLNAVYS
jgi:type II restriction enzyme